MVGTIRATHSSNSTKVRLVRVLNKLGVVGIVAYTSSSKSLALKNSKKIITKNTSTKVHLVHPIHLFIIIRKVEKLKCSFQPKDLSEPPIEPRNPTKFPLNQKTHHLNNEAMSFKSLE